MRSLRGKLLVATPGLLDPNFARAVVLLLDHDIDGAFGVVLNRPTDASLTDALPRWAGTGGEPEVVFIGGPVNPQGAIGLALTSLGEEPLGFAPLHGGLGIVDLELEPAVIRPRVERLRVFAGHSGWGSAQLDGEIASGSWFVVDADPGDPWSVDPLRLWRDVLRRQSGRVRVFANFPDDVRSN
jgi:putative transcriptional regulator